MLKSLPSLTNFARPANSSAVSMVNVASFSLYQVVSANSIQLVLSASRVSGSPFTSAASNVLFVVASFTLVTTSVSASLPDGLISTRSTEFSSAASAVAGIVLISIVEARTMPPTRLRILRFILFPPHTDLYCDTLLSRCGSQVWELGKTDPQSRYIFSR
ncbi:hypothetical protein [Butyricicoccus pullicaecorum]|uniref:hypothetical protein n=1 Tax=Butyricicoccus pullicaecorum TaxID=501571 RepID=UPI003990A0C0